MTDNVYFIVPLHPDKHLRRLQMDKRHCMYTLDWNKSVAGNAESTPVELIKIMIQWLTLIYCILGALNLDWNEPGQGPDHPFV